MKLIEAAQLNSNVKLRVSLQRMFELVTEIEINASPDRVWRVLTDFPAHAEWNPFVQEISGPLSVGAKLTVRVRPPGGRGMTFRPTVRAVTPGSEFRWLGHLLVPGLFDGEHYFRLSPVGNTSTRFVHGERFSGLLVSLARSSLDSGTRAGFEAMNQALKARAESLSP